ncbi:MAG: PTS sugar transporter subunit IIA [Acetobacter sp.]|nr:PTS sugar transporter subunit IIA [Acetobacter sp.]
MIGIVIVTHGQLADEFLYAMQHVVGHQEQIATACIGPNDDMNEKREDILTKVNTVDSGDGVIVLTDMFGGTPSNLAISIMDKANIEVIAGVNLPMLVKLNTLRKEKNLKDAVSGAKDAGIKYITIASELLGK